MRVSSYARCLLVVFCAGGLLAMVGCGGPKTVPVSGVATLNGKPLDRGILYFHPDASKGNTLTLGCRATIGGSGQYQLFTEDLSKVYKGAPVGWYKVTIVPLVPGNDTPIPVNQKFTDIEKTPLVIEVVANPPPGAYDLKFTK